MAEEFEIPPPEKAERLIGHHAASVTLAAQLSSGRPHHAWLLSGPRGVGKATVAYLAAKAVFSGAIDTPGSSDGDPALLNIDSESPASIQVANGARPGLFVYARRADPKTGKMRTQIDVEQVREHNGRIHLHTADGGWRVAIVDSINELNPASANALLKLLEEPPSKTLFFLVNHDGGGILPTIRSRCVTLGFGALSDEQVLQVLEEAGANVADGDARLIVQLAKGSAGRALDVIAADGLTLYREMIGFLRKLPRRDDRALHQFADKLVRDRQSARYSAFVDLLCDWIGKAATLRARNQPSAAFAYIPEEEAALTKLAMTGGVDRWCALWEKTTHLFRRADAANLDRKQTILDVFYGLEELGRTP